MDAVFLDLTTTESIVNVILLSIMENKHIKAYSLTGLIEFSLKLK